LQNALVEVVRQQTRLLRADLQVLGEENIVSGSERDSLFRKDVESEMERMNEELERIGRVFVVDV
jgi:predicted transcriptional regulator